MEFPTAEQFNRNKSQRETITKWRDLPKDIIYHILDVCEIETKFGKNSVANLIDGEGNKYKTSIPDRLSIELKDYGWQGRTAFVKSLGLKPKVKNPSQNYWDYDIMWAST